LRYRYGIFKQEIIDGYQVEVPDYWLDFNPVGPWNAYMSTDASLTRLTCHSGSSRDTTLQLM